MKKKVCLLSLTVLLLLSIVACGKSGQEETGEGEAGTEMAEYVYVPQFYTLETSEDGWINNSTLVGDKLYYNVYGYDEETKKSINFLAYRSLDDFDMEQKLDLQFSVENVENSDISWFQIDAAGNFYLIWNVYHMPENEEDYETEFSQDVYLAKYDSAGQELWTKDIKGIFDDPDNAYVGNMAVGKEGEVILTNEQTLFILDKEGNLNKKVTTDVDWVEALCTTETGKLLYMGYGMNGREIHEVDIATGAKGAAYKNVPDMNSCMKDAGNGKLYFAGYSELYEYDIATQESVPILSWIDSNIEGNYVHDLEILPDGRVLVFCDNYSSLPEVAVLTKTPASEVVQKQVITFATLYDGTNLTEEIVKFNKSNNQYQIKMKYYIDSSAEWTETTYSDGLALLYADIISKDAPDIIDLSGVDVASLVSKGAFEDLTPYLEKSTVANKTDFVESVLNAYNYNGVQVAVPTQFSIITLMGKSEQVGEKPGWKLDDVMALADQYPDADLLQYTSKEYALSMCLQYNSSSFIDFQAGTCSFNSPEFIKVLEFANRFPQEVNYNNDTSYPEMIQTGKVLLADVYFHDVQEFQMYKAMFEADVTCIGYPTVDGTPGVFITGENMCAVSAFSDCKEGAWAFVESTLKKSDDEYGRWMYPSRKEELEDLFEEAMKPEYQYDEDGNIMYDEDGNTIQCPKTTWGYDNWEVQIYAATQEEVDSIKEMIAMARPLGGADQTIFTIINEEAASYFKGQKSAQDVADIIQSRVEVYVSENY